MRGQVWQHPGQQGIGADWAGVGGGRNAELLCIANGGSNAGGDGKIGNADCDAERKSS